MAAVSSCEKHVSTGIRLPAEALSLLRRAAVDRAEREGGRVSVSGVVADLVRETLGREAGR